MIRCRIGLRIIGPLTRSSELGTMSQRTSAWRGKNTCYGFGPVQQLPGAAQLHFGFLLREGDVTPLWVSFSGRGRGARSGGGEGEGAEEGEFREEG